MPAKGHSCIAIAIVVILGSGAAHAGTACDFYVGKEYGGERITLYKGHALATGDGIVIDEAIPDIDDFQRLDNPGWKGGVASVRVQPGCTGIVADDADARSYTEDQADIGAFGIDAVAFACTCR